LHVMEHGVKGEEKGKYGLSKESVHAALEELFKEFRDEDGEREIDDVELEHYIEKVWAGLTKSSDPNAELTLSNFVRATAANEFLTVETLVKMFDQDRKKGCFEKCFDEGQKSAKELADDSGGGGVDIDDILGKCLSSKGKKKQKEKTEEGGEEKGEGDEKKKKGCCKRKKKEVAPAPPEEDKKDDKKEETKEEEKKDDEKKEETKEEEKPKEEEKKEEEKKEEEKKEEPAELS